MQADYITEVIGIVLITDKDGKVREAKVGDIILATDVINADNGNIVVTTLQDDGLHRDAATYNVTAESEIATGRSEAVGLAGLDQERNVAGADTPEALAAMRRLLSGDVTDPEIRVESSTDFNNVADLDDNDRFSFDDTTNFFGSDLDGDDIGSGGGGGGGVIITPPDPGPTPDPDINNSFGNELVIGRLGITDVATDLKLTHFDIITANSYGIEIDAKLLLEKLATTEANGEITITLPDNVRIYIAPNIGFVANEPSNIYTFTKNSILNASVATELADTKDIISDAVQTQTVFATADQNITDGFNLATVELELKSLLNNLQGSSNNADLISSVTTVLDLFENLAVTGSDIQAGLAAQNQAIQQVYSDYSSKQNALEIADAGDKFILVSTDDLDFDVIFDINTSIPYHNEVNIVVDAVADGVVDKNFSVLVEHNLFSNETTMKFNIDLKELDISNTESNILEITIPVEFASIIKLPVAVGTLIGNVLTVDITSTANYSSVIELTADYNAFRSIDINEFATSFKVLSTETPADVDDYAANNKIVFETDDSALTLNDKMLIREITDAEISNALADSSKVGTIDITAGLGGLTTGLTISDYLEITFSNTDGFMPEPLLIYPGWVEQSSNVWRLTGQALLDLVNSDPAVIQFEVDSNDDNTPDITTVGVKLNNGGSVSDVISSGASIDYSGDDTVLEAKFQAGTLNVNGVLDDLGITTLQNSDYFEIIFGNTNGSAPRPLNTLGWIQTDIENNVWQLSGDNLAALRATGITIIAGGFNSLDFTVNVSLYKNGSATNLVSKDVVVDAVAQGIADTVTTSYQDADFKGNYTYVTMPINLEFASLDPDGSESFVIKLKIPDFLVNHVDAENTIIVGMDSVTFSQDGNYLVATVGDITNFSGKIDLSFKTNMLDLVKSAANDSPPYEIDIDITVYSIENIATGDGEFYTLDNASEVVNTTVTINDIPVNNKYLSERQDSNAVDDPISVTLDINGAGELEAAAADLGKALDESEVSLRIIFEITDTTNFDPEGMRVTYGNNQAANVILEQEGNEWVWTLTGSDLTDYYHSGMGALQVTAPEHASGSYTIKQVELVELDNAGDITGSPQVLDNFDVAIPVAIDAEASNLTTTDVITSSEFTDNSARSSFMLTGVNFASADIDGSEELLELHFTLPTKIDGIDGASLPGGNGFDWQIENLDSSITVVQDGNTFTLTGFDAAFTDDITFSYNNSLNVLFSKLEIEVLVQVISEDSSNHAGDDPDNNAARVYNEVLTFADPDFEPKVLLGELQQTVIDGIDPVVLDALADVAQVKVLSLANYFLNIADLANGSIEFNISGDFTIMDASGSVLQNNISGADFVAFAALDAVDQYVLLVPKEFAHNDGTITIVGTAAGVETIILDNLPIEVDAAASSVDMGADNSVSASFTFTEVDGSVHADAIVDYNITLADYLDGSEMKNVYFDLTEFTTDFSQVRISDISDWTFNSIAQQGDADYGIVRYTPVEPNTTGVIQGNITIFNIGGSDAFKSGESLPIKLIVSSEEDSTIIIANNDQETTVANNKQTSEAAEIATDLNVVNLKEYQGAASDDSNSKFDINITAALEYIRDSISVQPESAIPIQQQIDDQYLTKSIQFNSTNGNLEFSGWGNTIPGIEATENNDGGYVISITGPALQQLVNHLNVESDFTLSFIIKEYDSNNFAVRLDAYIAENFEPTKLVGVENLIVVDPVASGWVVDATGAIDTASTYISVANTALEDAKNIPSELGNFVVSLKTAFADIDGNEVQEIVLKLPQNGLEVDFLVTPDWEYQNNNTELRYIGTIESDGTINTATLTFAYSKESLAEKQQTASLDANSGLNLEFELMITTKEGGSNDYSQTISASIEVVALSVLQNNLTVDSSQVTVRDIANANNADKFVAVSLLGVFAEIEAALIAIGGIVNGSVNPDSLELLLADTTTVETKMGRLLFETVINDAVLDQDKPQMMFADYNYNGSNYLQSDVAEGQFSITAQALRELFMKYYSDNEPIDTIYIQPGDTDYDFSFSASLDINADVIGGGSYSTIEVIKNIDVIVNPIPTTNIAFADIVNVDFGYAMYLVPDAAAVDSVSAANNVVGLVSYNLYVLNYNEDPTALSISGNAVVLVSQLTGSTREAYFYQDGVIVEESGMNLTTLYNVDGTTWGKLQAAVDEYNEVMRGAPDITYSMFNAAVEGALNTTDNLGIDANDTAYFKNGGSAQVELTHGEMLLLRDGLSGNEFIKNDANSKVFNEILVDASGSAGVTLASKNIFMDAYTYTDTAIGSSSTTQVHFNMHVNISLLDSNDVLKEITIDLPPGFGNSFMLTDYPNFTGEGDTGDISINAARTQITIKTGGNSSYSGTIRVEMLSEDLMNYHIDVANNGSFDVTTSIKYISANVDMGSVFNETETYDMPAFVSVPIDNVVSGLQISEDFNSGIGNDTISIASSSMYQIHGGEGNDTINGSSGNDKLYGDAGNDILYGNAGNDIIYGGTGDDIIDGGIGNDTIYGVGVGADTIFAQNGGDDFIVFDHGAKNNDGAAKDESYRRIIDGNAVSGSTKIYAERGNHVIEDDMHDKAFYYLGHSYDGDPNHDDGVTQTVKFHYSDVDADTVSTTGSISSESAGTSAFAGATIHGFQMNGESSGDVLDFRGLFSSFNLGDVFTVKVDRGTIARDNGAGYNYTSFEIAGKGVVEFKEMDARSDGNTLKDIEITVNYYENPGAGLVTGIEYSIANLQLDTTKSWDNMGDGVSFAIGAEAFARQSWIFNSNDNEGVTFEYA